MIPLTYSMNREKVIPAIGGQIDTSRTHIESFRYLTVNKFNMLKWNTLNICKISLSYNLEFSMKLWIESPSPDSWHPIVSAGWGPQKCEGWTKTRSAQLVHPQGSPPRTNLLGFHCSYSFSNFSNTSSLGCVQLGLVESSKADGHVTLSNLCVFLVTGEEPCLWAEQDSLQFPRFWKRMW